MKTETAVVIPPGLVEEPLGQQTNSIRWLQKRILEQSAKLPRDFQSRGQWEAFKQKLRQELPCVIGIPQLPPLQESRVRARLQVGDDVICERVDVYVDGDYSIPTFVFSPLKPARKRLPALVWNPGWPEDKWKRSYQQMAVRLVRQGFVVLVLDHAPFGETSQFDKQARNMTLLMGAGHVLGISQLALRSAETSRVGQYLRSRQDVDPKRVALAGLCQGGQDSWLTGALDDEFCAVAPFCSATTFTIHFAEMASYHANSDASPFPFGVLNVCEVEHLHAAIAPRPLLVRANLNDCWWPVSGFAVVEEFTRKIYRLYGAEDRMDFRAEVHEHDLTGPFLDALEQFLLKYVRPDQASSNETR